MTKPASKVQTTFDLSRDAILVKVSIRQYTGRKKDELLAAQAAAQHSADKQAIEMYLTSLEKADRLPIQKLATAARQYLNENSAVWDDSGWRLISNAVYEQRRSELERLGIEFEAAKNALIARRDELEDKARTRLGPTLFSRIGFPTAEELRAEYKYEVLTQPITNPGDIRMRHVSAETVRQIEATTRRGQNEKVQDALKQLVQRLFDVVERVASTLHNGDSIFRDTLILNVRELCEIVPALNLTNDPWITKVTGEIADSLGVVEPQVLREDKEARAEVAKTATNLLSKLKKFKPTDKI
jgi:hypothetical protein